MIETEEKQEQQAIVVNTKEQVKILIYAGQLAAKTTRYDKGIGKQPPKIWFSEGAMRGNNPTLTEFLKKAEEKIVADMMPEIIKEAEAMINAELNHIKELLK